MLCHYHFTKVVLWRMRVEPRPSSRRRGPAEIGANRLQLLRWPILIARTQRFGRGPSRPLVGGTTARGIYRSSSGLIDEFGYEEATKILLDARERRHAGRSTAECSLP
jgi:hypothetical protein